MTARALEASGIATIIIGSAMDIVTHCHVPRYLHNNFPLGNPLGPPWDRDAQRHSVTEALTILSESSEPTVCRSPLQWPTGDGWQDVYNRVDATNRAELLKTGEQNRARRAADKAQGLKR